MPHMTPFKTKLYTITVPHLEESLKQNPPASSGQGRVPHSHPTWRNQSPCTSAPSTDRTWVGSRVQLGALP